MRYAPLYTELRLCLSLLVLCLALAACGGDDKPVDQEKRDAQQEQAVPLAVVKVETRDMPQWEEFVGQVNAKETVDIRARVEGFLQERNFKEGDQVAKGQLLFVIDPRTYEENLKQALAKVAKNQTELAKAQKDTARFQRLAKQGAVSQDEFEQYDTQRKTLEATIKDDQAAVEKAKLDLGYTKVYSPISGTIGKAQVDVGNLVGKGENTLLATVSTVDPVYVDFSISERAYLTAVKNQPVREANASANTGGAPKIQIILADDSIYPFGGAFDMADRTVNAQTGTLGVRAVFPNPDGMLRPGQYAKVKALIDEMKAAVVVPIRALVDIQGVKSVYVVDAEGVVRSRPVTLVGGDNSVVVVSQGVQAGDLVVAEGVNRVRVGMKATAQVAPYPDAKAAGTSTPSANATQTP